MATTTAAPLTLHEWAVEVDNVLAILWNERERARHYRQGAVDTLHRIANHHKVHGRFFDHWTASRTDHTRMTAQDAFEKAAKVAEREPKTYIELDAARAITRVAEFDREIEALGEAIAEFEAEWDELRWSRFFLVKANNGHIHSSMNCPTCNRNGVATSFGWLPNLSGLTEAEAVAEHGTILCSVCFPSAPVEWTVGKAKPTGCPGSGSFVPFIEGKSIDVGGGRVRKTYTNSRYVTCPECGEIVARTQNGNTRKHQPKKES